MGLAYFVYRDYYYHTQIRLGKGSVSKTISPLFIWDSLIYLGDYTFRLAG
jgi:hypothetical protein